MLGHIDAFIKHDNPAMADQTIGSGKCFIIERQMKLIDAVIGTQRPTNLHRAHWLTRFGAAAYVIDQRTQRDAKCSFKQAAIFDIASQLDWHRPL